MISLESLQQRNVKEILNNTPVARFCKNRGKNEWKQKWCRYRGVPFKNWDLQYPTCDVSYDGPSGGAVFDTVPGARLGYEGGLSGLVQGLR